MHFVFMLLLVLAAVGCSENKSSEADASLDASTSPDAVTPDGAAPDSAQPDANRFAAKSCVTEHDCVLAMDFTICCPNSRCASAYNAEHVAANPCISTTGSDVPGECVPGDCDECPGPPFSCTHAEYAVCIEGRCDTAGIQ